MKKHRTLYSLLALCLAAGLIWYGCIAVLQKGASPLLVDVKGDRAALQGFSLEGLVTDGSFEYPFTLKDGELSCKFRAVDHNSSLDNFDHSWAAYPKMVPAQTGHFTTPEIKNYPDSELTSWTMRGDRFRIMLECNLFSYTPNTPSQCTLIDTGLEVQGDAEEFTFHSSFDKSQGLFSLWAESSAIPLSTIAPRASYVKMCSTEDQIFAVYNLPWGGAQIHQITTMEPQDQYAKQVEQIMGSSDTPPINMDSYPIGESQLVYTLSPSEASQILELYPLGDHYIVLTQSNVDMPCFVLNENHTLQDVPGPKADVVEARVYDAQWNCTDIVPLMELPENDTLFWNVSATQYLPSSSGFDDLNLKLTASAQSGSENSTQTLECAALLRLENGRLTVHNTRLFHAPAPTPTDDAAFIDSYPTLLTSGMDETGTKSIQLWFAGYLRQNNWAQAPVGGQLYVDVWQQDELLYRGELQTGWLDDIYNGVAGGAHFGNRFRIIALPALSEAPGYEMFDPQTFSYTIPYAQH